MLILKCNEKLISFRFEICRKLGQGTYGKVQLGINKETGQQVLATHFRLLITR